MLLMVAPPLLIAGQPLTLLLHASRNPLHTWAKRVLRSPVASFLTWPVFGAVAYALAVLAAHLTSLANYVERNQTAHNAEHALFVLIGYLFFLPILGREPIRWRLSYPIRFVDSGAADASGHFHRPCARLRQRELARRPGRAAAAPGRRRRSPTCTWAAR